jgi:hypothetical protein
MDANKRESAKGSREGSEDAKGTIVKNPIINHEIYEMLTGILLRQKHHGGHPNAGPAAD